MPPRPRRWRGRLLAHDDVEPIGLGARDQSAAGGGACAFMAMTSISTTSPVEAGLTWAIQKVRRTGGDRAGGFPGADRILHELENGAARKRVGLRPEGRAPMREGTDLFAGDEGGDPIGHDHIGRFWPNHRRADVDGLCARGSGHTPAQDFLARCAASVCRSRLRRCRLHLPISNADHKRERPR